METGLLMRGWVGVKHEEGPGRDRSSRRQQNQAFPSLIMTHLTNGEGGGDSRWRSVTDRGKKKDLMERED